MDFADVLPEASGKDNGGIHSPSRGAEDNSHLRRVRVSALKSRSLCFHVKLALKPSSCCEWHKISSLHQWFGHVG